MSDYALALDVGGTFTDVIMLDKTSGQLWTTKTPSTADDPAQGFFHGVDKIVALAAIDPARLQRVFHGSTVATNTILEGKGARTGMIVTDGFKYVLEIGRHDIPRKENLYTWVKPARPVPPRQIIEVPERVLLDGTVEQPLDEDRCRAALAQLKALQVESVAVVLLHAYANPVNEQRVAALLAEVFPEAQVSVSSEILPVFREYERAMTTVLNAYIQPRVSRYIGSLETGLRERSIAAPLLIMKSGGGVFSPQQAGRQAIHLALSGPAAGVIGAGFVAELSGYANAITIDIGGTSADVSLIRQGRPTVTGDGEIGPFPLPIPIVDIHTVGAGGGSIASVTGQGSLLVGPKSSGAAPGPACYGQGGTLPTVTDANLVLGRIPEHLLGGEVQLQRELAEKAIHDHIAVPLGMTLIQAAAGMLAIVNNNMVGALKVVSVEKGYDPREFALIAFGGAGPMQAGELAALLGTPTIIIPTVPGILCALGLLATDLQYDYVRTCLQRAPDYDLQTMEATYRTLLEEADTCLHAEGIARERRRFTLLADLRYAKQGYELTVELSSGERIDHAALAQLVEGFHQLHEQLYTFADREAPVEIVNLRVKALGLVDKLELPRLASADHTEPAATAARQVYFPESGFSEVPVYARSDLLAGHVIMGPAIVDQLDTTTVIFPGQRARVDEFGHFIISR